MLEEVCDGSRTTRQVRRVAYTVKETEYEEHGDARAASKASGEGEEQYTGHNVDPDAAKDLRERGKKQWASSRTERRDGDGQCGEYAAVDVELVSNLRRDRREHGRHEVAASLSVRAASIQRLTTYVQRIESPMSNTLSILRPCLQLQGFLGSLGPSQFTMLGSVLASRLFSTDAVLVYSGPSEPGPASAMAAERCAMPAKRRGSLSAKGWGKGGS